MADFSSNFASLTGWETAAGASGPIEVASNVCSAPGLGFYSSIYTAEAFENNQFAEVVLAARGDYSLGTVVRAGASGGYYFYINTLTYSSGEIGWFDTGGWGNQLAALNFSVAPADALRLAISGWTLSVLLNGDVVASVEDTGNRFASGSPGVIIYGAPTGSNFLAGPLAEGGGGGNGSLIIAMMMQGRRRRA